MNRVYILVYADVDDTVIMGVFSTFEKAQNELKAQVKSDEYNYHIDEYMVQ